MADLFISYSRRDKEIARAVAQLMESDGFEVWWDEELYVGQHFPSEIERAIEEAKFVIVIWSAHSVKSEWVLREVRYALSRRNLLPVQIDDCEIPSAYQSIHTIKFTDWPRLLEGMHRGIGVRGHDWPRYGFAASVAVHRALDPKGLERMGAARQLPRLSESERKEDSVPITEKPPWWKLWRRRRREEAVRS